jgi:membrane protein implicated in regulation of membrane protease activity
VLGALLDYLENVATSLVMARYPLRTPVIDALAPVFTLVKWVFVGGSFALLLIGAGAALWRWVRRRGAG